MYACSHALCGVDAWRMYSHVLCGVDAKFMCNRVLCGVNACRLCKHVHMHIYICVLAQLLLVHLRYVCSVHRPDASPHTLGVFAARDFIKGEVVCFCPGIVVTEATVVEQQSSYMWALVSLNKADNFESGEVNTWYDATAFKAEIIPPDRVGQLINTIDVTCAEFPYNIENIVFQVADNKLNDYTSEQLIVAVAKVNIKEGEECLTDYHWHLATDDAYLCGRKYACKCSKCRGTII